MWVVQYWLDMYEVWNKRHSWDTGQQWLVRNSQGSAEQAKFDQCHAYLGSMSWNTKMLVFLGGTYMTMADFAVILSDSMVSTTIIDIMTSVIHEQIQQDEVLSERFEVVGWSFYMRLASRRI